MSVIRCLQINLHHAKAASDVLSWRFIKDSLDLALIQEPWLIVSPIKGLQTQKGKLIYNSDCENPRAAILINARINYAPISRFIQRDIAAVVVEIPSNGGKIKAVMVSAHFPEAEASPPEAVRSFITLLQKDEYSVSHRM